MGFKKGNRYHKMRDMDKIRIARAAALDARQPLLDLIEFMPGMMTTEISRIMRTEGISSGRTRMARMALEDDGWLVGVPVQMHKNQGFRWYLVDHPRVLVH